MNKHECRQNHQYAAKIRKNAMHIPVTCAYIVFMWHSDLYLTKVDLAGLEDGLTWFYIHVGTWLQDGSLSVDCSWCIVFCYGIRKVGHWNAELDENTKPRSIRYVIWIVLSLVVHISIYMYKHVHLSFKWWTQNNLHADALTKHCEFHLCLWQNATWPYIKNASVKQNQVLVSRFVLPF